MNIFAHCSLKLRLNDFVMYLEYVGMQERDTYLAQANMVHMAHVMQRVDDILTNSRHTVIQIYSNVDIE